MKFEILEKHIQNVRSSIYEHSYISKTNSYWEIKNPKLKTKTKHIFVLKRSHRIVFVFFFDFFLLFICLIIFDKQRGEFRIHENLKYLFYLLNVYVWTVLQIHRKYFFSLILLLFFFTWLLLIFQFIFFTLYIILLACTMWLCVVEETKVTIYKFNREKKQHKKHTLCLRWLAYNRKWG